MKKILLLFVVAIGLSACKSGSDRVVKLKKGQQYTQHIVIEMTTSQNILGNETSFLSISDVVNDIAK